ncbi:MAG: UDP-N-acetylmuramoyl-L-alanyl-D-glutamate--2,6-diaminopimelate ligase [Bacteroidetes bacterium RIFCSPLOWO2_12_FULL_37_12]|nr:MAG: UDP-N-acetylmuramoyl-L-alanyl-D-glutamate--2,6-diaminopimelate ligase [Bacteroidetes bacterium RIFCSPLOWO2_12_FULL_37_12]
MKLLKDILYKVPISSIVGRTDLQVDAITADSRKSGGNSVFVAVKGTQSDGHEFISKAINNGASVIVCQQLSPVLQKENEHITFVQVEDSARTLGIIASNFYDNPSSKLKLVGITGTNGKTSCATLLYELFMLLGYNSGLISTIKNCIGAESIPATHTTPDPVTLNSLLNKMVQNNCTHCFMEVSSHAIVQERIAGLEFSGAVFTNITHDHLDYHKTFDNYIKAKKRFFDLLTEHSFALINADDKHSGIMLQNSKAVKKTFGIHTLSDFKVKIIENTFSGLHLEINGKDTWFSFNGIFNAYNLGAIVGTAVLLGQELSLVLEKLSSLQPVRGRFEKLVSPNQVIGIIDYAHTPDALENVLNTIHECINTNQKVLTVVGCGGNRDTSKRPIMAEVACRLSDTVIFTSDNPRSENPMLILEQMQKGIPAIHLKDTLLIPDRKEAIKTAYSMSKQGDILLIAGKGHENYQEINGIKYPFDDKDVLCEVMKEENRK